MAEGVVARLDQSKCSSFSRLARFGATKGDGVCKLSTIVVDAGDELGIAMSTDPTETVRERRPTRVGVASDTSSSQESCVDMDSLVESAKETSRFSSDSESRISLAAMAFICQSNSAATSSSVAARKDPIFEARKLAAPAVRICSFVFFCSVRIWQFGLTVYIREVSLFEITVPASISHTWCHK